MNYLKSLKSYKPFNPCFIPVGVTLSNIERIFDFISPSIIILHGSCVTGKRYSPISKDIDIILINNKHIFWDMESIFQVIDINKNKEKILIDFDISITTQKGFINHLKNETSLGVSINQGFSIILPRYNNEY